MSEEQRPLTQDDIRDANASVEAVTSFVLEQTGSAKEAVILLERASRLIQDAHLQLTGSNFNF